MQKKRRRRKHELNKKCDPFYFSSVSICLVCYSCFYFFHLVVSESGAESKQQREEKKRPWKMHNVNMFANMFFIFQRESESELLGSYLERFSFGAFGLVYAMQLESLFHHTRIETFTLQADHSNDIFFSKIITYALFSCPCVPSTNHSRYRCHSTYLWLPTTYT